jgi:hypothetical protein
MATIVRFKITSPRAGFTGEGAGMVYFRDSEAELAVDLDNWEPGNARGALFYFSTQGFRVEALDGVTVEQALRDPSQEATAVQAELDDLDRQIRAENSRDLLEAKRQELADLRAKRAAESKASAGGEEGDKTDSAPLTTDVPPPSPDAPVADWRAYAVEIDPQLDDKAAKTLTRDVLITTYGGAYTAQEGAVTA